MSALPKIRLNKTEMTDADFKQELEKKASKYIGPGNHEVKILDKEYLGTAEQDPTWMKFRVTMTNTAGESINDMILVPTASLKYMSAKPTMFPARKLSEFFAAVGEDFTPSKAAELLNNYFIGDGLLKKTLNIDVGYRTSYIKYVGKDSYIIVDRDGYVIKDEKGEPLPIFNDRDSAAKFAEERSIKIDKFAGVLKYNPGEEIADEDDGEDIPF